MPRICNHNWGWSGNTHGDAANAGFRTVARCQTCGRVRFIKTYIRSDEWAALGPYFTRSLPQVVGIALLLMIAAPFIYAIAGIIGVGVYLREVWRRLDLITGHVMTVHRKLWWAWRENLDPGCHLRQQVEERMPKPMPKDDA